jgi:GNAT superfamily N-acetyltransferase
VTRTGLTTVLGSDLDDAGLRAVRDIYEDAFPARQRMPFDEIVASARAGERLLLVAVDDGEPVAFGTVLPLSAANTGYVEYFAVRAGDRGAGRGSDLWRELLDRAARERGVDAVVLEVEDPADATDGDDAEERRRRVQFYERLGARILPVPGFRAINLDGSGTEPMHLMWSATRPGVEPPGDAAAVVRALYEEGYEMPPDSPVIADVIASMG